MDPNYPTDDQNDHDGNQPGVPAPQPTPAPPPAPTPAPPAPAPAPKSPSGPSW